MGGELYPGDQENLTVVPDAPGDIAWVLGVYDNASLTGTNYMTGKTGGFAIDSTGNSPGLSAGLDPFGRIELVKQFASGGSIYIKYKRTGFNPGDTTVWLTTPLSAGGENSIVYMQSWDMRFLSRTSR